MRIVRIEEWVINNDKEVRKYLSKQQNNASSWPPVSNIKEMYTYDHHYNLQSNNTDWVVLKIVNIELLVTVKNLT